MPKEPHPIWGWNRPDENGWRKYHVVGTRTFQDRLKRINLGDRIDVFREPKRGDKNSIAVYGPQGERLGWLEEKDTALLAPAMDDGLNLHAISAVTPDRDAFLVGLWIWIKELL